MDYKEKLRLAKEALDSSSYNKETIEYIFPELKESEDERIKNFISNELMCLRAVEYNSGGKDSDRYKELTSAIDWLEKQGDDKVEQKSAEWSEEDENIIVKIKTKIAQCNGFNKKNREEVFDLIDSLKPQPAWKPSKEQISVLSRSLKYINTISPNYCHVLKELLAQLNKLREE